jgi:type I restriction enzyme S subunit
MSELPPGWMMSTLGDIGQYLNGRGFKKSEWRDSGRPIIRIQNLTGTRSHFNYFDGVPEDRYTARPGDLLVSWAATLGVFVWNGPEAVVNQHIFKVRSRIDRRFHRYLLLHVLDDLKRQSHGSGMVHITKSRFEETPVAVPPLAEQPRIVAAIEEHFSRLDAAEGSLRRASRRLAVFRRQVLSLAARCGDERRVGDLVERIEAGKSFKCHARRADLDEWGVVKVSAMTWGSFDESENKAVVSDEQVDPRWEIKHGDLLLSRANTTEYVGASVLVRECRPRLLLSDKSMRLVVRPGVDREWLQLALSAPQARAQMSAVATGTSDSMRNISQEKVKAIRLRVPSLEEQRGIVAEVERQLSLADAVSTQGERAVRRTSALRRSVLDQACGGRLVPQDPSDGQASALLRRIAAERVGASNRSPKALA